MRQEYNMKGLSWSDQISVTCEMIVMAAVADFSKQG